MSKSAIDYTASSFSPAEADRLGKTLNVLDAVPDNVSTAQLMMSVADTFYTSQTHRPGSNLPDNVDLHRTTHTILGDVTLKDLKVSLDPDKNVQYTGEADDERRRLFVDFTQRIREIQLAGARDLARTQYLTTSQGTVLPRTTTPGASRDDWKRPTQTAELALALESLVSYTKSDMKSSMGKKSKANSLADDRMCTS